MKRVRAAVTDVPVPANIGVTIDNVKEIFSIADGCVIGAHLKVDSNAWNPADRERVKRFMGVVEKLS